MLHFLLHRKSKAAIEGHLFRCPFSFSMKYSENTKS
nr:MAG TPA: hypothetical protein [Caudoviricetes sp.]